MIKVIKKFAKRLKTESMVNKIVRIISDNENYIDYIGIDLVVTHSSNKGLGYDNSLFPMMLLDLDYVVEVV